VSTRDDWFASETVAENGLRCQVDGGKLGPVELPGVAVVLSGAMYDVRRLAEPVALRDAWAGVEPRALTREVDESHADAGARPLAGLRVLDLASFVAGTFGPSILASLGADVVKVETSVGDPYRDFLAAFAAYNQRKRCLGLDVKHPEGHRVLMDLVGKADVLVDGVRPSVRGRLGIDDASLRAVNPRIIRCSVTGWGDEGPLAETPAFDPLLQARSGLMAAQGGDSMPVYVAMLVHDVGAGTLAALGILAALYQRRSTGAGQEVKVSLASSSVLFQSGELTHFEGRTPPDVGGRDWPGPRAVERLYECADGWLLLDARTELSRRALADAVGGSWPDPASAPSDGPFADAVAALLAPLTTEAALDRMLVAGVPAVPVLPRHAVYTDGWLAEHGVFHTFEQPGLGPCTAVAGYARWRDHDVSYDGPAPRNGEHTRSLLAEAGLDDAEVEALISSGAAHVLESPPAR
jgi:crotonobetainyl-CoA:carnitine CoA-transferase CaiB-like acyl-CoA transferase